MRRRKQKARIYQGPPGAETAMFYEGKVTNATKRFPINGAVSHALRAKPGTTVGCALSWAIFDSRDTLDHPCHLVAVTKSTVLVLAQLPVGSKPGRIIRYGHNMGHIVDDNDVGALKQMVKDDPEIMERTFTIGPPRKSGPVTAVVNRDNETPGSGSGGGSAPAAIPAKRPSAHKGALRRAVKAGLIDTAVAEQLTRAVKKKAA